MDGGNDGPGNGAPPDCTGAAGGAPRGNSRDQQDQGRNQVQELFGDSNAAILVLILVVLHVLQHAMQDPCTC